VVKCANTATESRKCPTSRLRYIQPMSNTPIDNETVLLSESKPYSLRNIDQPIPKLRASTF